VAGKACRMRPLLPAESRPWSSSPPGLTRCRAAPRTVAAGHRWTCA